MRLTAQLIENSLSYINPLLERELDLRGHRIPDIENLGAAGNQYCIDFTDNALRSLSNFPLSPRLCTLLCGRNRIAFIHTGLAQALPNLESLVLTHNRLATLSDLSVLSKFPKLTYLSLVDNPVTQLENYRYWVVWLCPSLRFLDFERVRLSERDFATKLFGTISAPSEAAVKILGKLSKSYEATPASFSASDHGGSKKIHGRSSPTSSSMFSSINDEKVLPLDPEERERLLKRIKTAKTLAEIQKLQKIFEERTTIGAGRVARGGAGGGGVGRAIGREKPIDRSQTNVEGECDEDSSMADADE